MVHSKKKTQAVILCTESFDLDGVKLLQVLNLKWYATLLQPVQISGSVLVDKFKLDCTIFAYATGHKIRILKKSLPDVQALIKDLMPPMMKYKIGL
jgi:hypothetical protein